MTLLASGITVRYPGAARPSLCNVDLQLNAGELLVIAGPNGSGKTTLQRALLGLTALERGTVSLDGKPIQHWSRRAVAEQIGALPQREDAVFSLTVAETVLLGRWAHLGPMAPISRADEAAVTDALARCDVSGLAARYSDTLSGGEWQRVRLARALAASPRILLLDEPTAALDIAHEMELFELLRGLVAEGLGILVITHQLSLAARYATRVILLNQGEVAASGAPREALTSERLSDVFSWPIHVSVDADGTSIITPTRRLVPHREGIVTPHSQGIPL